MKELKIYLKEETCDKVKSIIDNYSVFLERHNRIDAGPRNLGFSINTNYKIEVVRPESKDSKTLNFFIGDPKYLYEAEISLEDNTCLIKVEKDIDKKLLLKLQQIFIRDLAKAIDDIFIDYSTYDLKIENFINNNE